MQNCWAFNIVSYFIGACGGCGASVLSPIGEILASSKSDDPRVVHTINTDCAIVHLDYNKEKIEQAVRKYGMDLTVRDPGKLGRVLLSCESEALSIHEIMEEFAIEPLDEYLNRAQTAAQKNLIKE